MSTALNLDGQLATRDELRTEIMSVREEIREGFAGVDRRFADADQRMTTGFAAADQRMTTGFADAARGLADLEVKLGATTRSLFFQMLGLQLSAAAIVFAFLKLL